MTAKAVCHCGLIQIELAKAPAQVTDCNCSTHWSAVDPARDRMGVNTRLLDPEILATVKIHHYSGADR